MWKHTSQILTTVDLLSVYNSSVAMVAPCRKHSCWIRQTNWQPQLSVGGDRALSSGLNVTAVPVLATNVHMAPLRLRCISSHPATVNLGQKFVRNKQEIVPEIL